MNLLATPIKKVVGILNIFGGSVASQNRFILYKIVDSYLKSGVEYFKMQCINTKAVFDVLLQDIVSDADLLYGLHPIQGCYVGIEYAKVFKTEASGTKSQTRSSMIFSRYSSNRYGNKQLVYQKRDGLLGFECKISGEQSIMDPRDIALTKELIGEFDAVQAFCIGVLAGLKFNGRKEVSIHKSPRPSLRLIVK